MVGTKLGEDALRYDGETAPLAAYQQIVNLKSDNVGYHADMDHYGVNLGDGNPFE